MPVGHAPKGDIEQRRAALPENWNDLVITSVMPAFYEEKTIESAVRALQEVPLNIDLVVVNVGSVDNTAC